MATFRKRGSSWRAEVRMGGVYESGTFPSKLKAERWATQLEADIAAEKHDSTARKTLGELLEKYGEEVSPKKRTGDREAVRIAFYKRMKISERQIGDLTAADFKDLRDSRLKEVSSATVRRDFILLNHAINIAIREWGWLQVNPMATIDKPQDAPPRDRRITPQDVDRLLHAAGYSREHAPTTTTARIGAAFLFAIETGMRLSEIVDLNWDRVFIEQRFLRLDITKNGSKREVPLSAEAIRILKQLPRASGDNRTFLISSARSADPIFRKVRIRAGLEDLHFHDTRHEAITRLARKLDVLALARMVGHKNIKQLQTYYNESATELAERL